MNVTLDVSSERYTGWTAISVRRSIEEVPSTFSVDFNPSAITKIPHPSMPCVLSIDDTPLISGWIQTVNIEQGPESESGSITGRSAVCDAVDSTCQITPGQFFESRLDIIAEYLLEPLGLVLVVEVDDIGEDIEAFQVEPGETAFDAVERLCRMRGFLLTDDTTGNLLLTRAGNNLAQTRLVYPGNVITRSISLDEGGRYNTVRCYGQTKSTANRKAKKAVVVAGDATDSAVRPGRYLTVKLEEPANSIKDCETRAAWELALRSGRSTSLSYTVEGWLQDNGELWEPNYQVQVLDPFLGVDATLLIVAVEYTYGEDGFKTTLELGPVSGWYPESPDAYQERLGEDPLAGIDLWSRDND